MRVVVFLDVDSKRTDGLLYLNKASLRLVSVLSLCTARFGS